MRFGLLLAALALGVAAPGVASADPPGPDAPSRDARPGLRPPRLGRLRGRGPGDRAAGTGRVSLLAGPPLRPVPRRAVVLDQRRGGLHRAGRDELAAQRARDVVLRPRHPLVDRRRPGAPLPAGRACTTCGRPCASSSTARAGMRPRTAPASASWPGPTSTCRRCSACRSRRTSSTPSRSVDVSSLGMQAGITVQLHAAALTARGAPTAAGPSPRRRAMSAIASRSEVRPPALRTTRLAPCSSAY